MKMLGWIVLLIGVGVLILEFARGGELSLVGAGVAVAGVAVVFSQEESHD